MGRRTRAPWEWASPAYATGQYSSYSRVGLSGGGGEKGKGSMGVGTGQVLPMQQVSTAPTVGWAAATFRLEKET